MCPCLFVCFFFSPALSLSLRCFSLYVETQFVFELGFCFLCVSQRFRERVFAEVGEGFGGLFLFLSFRTRRMTAASRISVIVYGACRLTGLFSRDAVLGFILRDDASLSLSLFLFIYCALPSSRFLVARSWLSFRN